MQHSMTVPLSRLDLNREDAGVSVQAEQVKRRLTVSQASLQKPYASALMVFANHLATEPNSSARRTAKQWRKLRDADNEATHQPAQAALLVQHTEHLSVVRTFYTANCGLSRTSIDYFSRCLTIDI